MFVAVVCVPMKLPSWVRVMFVLLLSFREFRCLAGSPIDRGVLVSVVSAPSYGFFEFG